MKQLEGRCWPSRLGSIFDYADMLRERDGPGDQEKGHGATGRVAGYIHGPGDEAADGAGAGTSVVEWACGQRVEAGGQGHRRRAGSRGSRVRIPSPAPDSLHGDPNAIALARDSQLLAGGPRSRTIWPCDCSPGGRSSSQALYCAFFGYTGDILRRLQEDRGQRRQPRCGRRHRDSDPRRAHPARQPTTFTEFGQQNVALADVGGVRGLRRPRVRPRHLHRHRRDAERRRGRQCQQANHRRGHHLRGNRPEHGAGGAGQDLDRILAGLLRRLRWGRWAIGRADISRLSPRRAGSPSRAPASSARRRRGLSQAATPARPRGAGFAACWRPRAPGARPPTRRF